MGENVVLILVSVGRGASNIGTGSLVNSGVSIGVVSSGGGGPCGIPVLRL